MKEELHKANIKSCYDSRRITEEKPPFKAGHLIFLSREKSEGNGLTKWIAPRSYVACTKQGEGRQNHVQIRSMLSAATEIARTNYLQNNSYTSTEQPAELS